MRSSKTRLGPRVEDLLSPALVDLFILGHGRMPRLEMWMSVWNVRKIALARAAGCGKTGFWRVTSRKKEERNEPVDPRLEISKHDTIAYDRLSVP